MLLKRYHNKIFFWILWGVSVSSCLQGCSFLKTTGRTAKAVGEAGWKTAKVTGQGAVVVGKVFVKSGQVVGGGARAVVYMARGKQIIPLHKEGNSFYADVKLNGVYKTKLLVDTGASNMQITQAMARRLRIDPLEGEPVRATLAGGAVVFGRRIILKEVRLGRVKVKNIEAIVLDGDHRVDDAGLLGMSFLNHFIFQMDTRKSQLILEQRS